MKELPPAVLLLLALAVTSTQAETVKDREGAIRQDQAAFQGKTRWTYNSWEQGREAARTSGKPMLVVLRCVPCLACAGIDGSVLNESETLAPLLDQFECVRLINANALDLSLFQFDYDLSFSALLLNADGTIYGRYGSWSHQKNPAETDTASFRLALEGALALHRDYPDNQTSLAGKQGLPSPFKTSLDLPDLATKYTRELDWSGVITKSCVHCHMIGDAHRAWYREQDQPMPLEWIFPHPSPASVGLTLAPDSATKVLAVEANSLAAASGVQTGDLIVKLGGQALISAADFSWALHRAPGSGTLPMTLRRGEASVEATLTLPQDWRFKTSEPRRVATWNLRGMATGGMRLIDASDAERAAASLDANSLALRVDFVGQYNKHAAAKKAGFQVGDILTSVDGMTNHMDEGELMGRLLQKSRPDDEVEVILQRGSDQLTLRLPMQ